MLMIWQDMAISKQGHDTALDFTVICLPTLRYCSTDHHILCSWFLFGTFIMLNIHMKLMDHGRVWLFCSNCESFNVLSDSDRYPPPHPYTLPLYRPQYLMRLINIRYIRRQHHSPKSHWFCPGGLGNLSLFGGSKNVAIYSECCRSRVSLYWMCLVTEQMIFI